eukprot:jgi/Tetstr1/459163/TSEL_004609.t1
MSGRGGGGRGGGGRFGAGRGGSSGGRGLKVLNKNFMRNNDDRGGGGPTELAVENAAADAREARVGFPLFTGGEERLGWLMNLNTTSVEDGDSGQVLSAVACYFMCQDGSMFKAKVLFAPYFYLQVKDNFESEVETYLKRSYGGRIKTTEIVQREDLDLKNHLAGIKRQLLKVSFFNVQQLMDVKRDLMDVVHKNQSERANTDVYAVYAAGGSSKAHRTQDALEYIEDMREYDVPYHQRFAIDMDVRAGQWFMVSASAGVISLSPRKDLLQRAEPRICAFDIETTKLPLQFPNAEYDQVFMISYMIDKQGYLIVNREVVTEDIDSFEYTPKPEFEGPFTVFNEANEYETLRRWFDHMREVKPGIYVTYNGDYFDWPFIETRAAKLGMDMEAEITFKMQKSGESLSKAAIHMDCFAWVNRDSYLPQGSRGLKAVTKAKLGYDPVEVPPEDMLRMAQEEPQGMASYSVSDAVSTYYLYMTYIHPFIFSLATIIPMPPDEVLRKGSGTLCETLLMVQAYQANIVAPNKHQSKTEQFHEGRLLESETYIGGHVEALESGVFRADLPTKFKCTPEAYQSLIDNLDRDLEYAITQELKTPMEDVTDYEEVKATIREQLEGLRDTPNREEVPIIYHLDVAAMYPNIILTNRLQPPAIVTEEDCAACDFNKPGKNCLRKMEWVWRGETYAASRSEYLHIKNQLKSEMMPPEYEGGPQRHFKELPREEQQKLIKQRFKSYNQKVYKRVLDKPHTEVRTAGSCMRENDFYVGTVRAFRDRRYEYKGLNKVWKGKLDSAKDSGNPIKVQEAADMVVLYDSLQLAHKCILNSFYGYVMRKGARWYSMEMAGVVTYTGARIIQAANALIEQLGKPLELDTDGIWCALPGSFPENFKFTTKKGKALKISYPCVMLNVMVAINNTNDQYQTLVDPASRTYKVTSEMSIEFEVDGPYQAMVLPAAKEEGKTIKKRYAVFNFDGSLAELKGFELKRRGELKLVKVFQAEVFSQFLEGTSLEECYTAVAKVADRWLDMLDTQGEDLTDDELLEYISEATVMSKTVEEYDGRKSAAITTAKRLGEFLGDERLKDKASAHPAQHARGGSAAAQGLVCTYVVAKEPADKKTTDRAVPIAIFQAEPAVSMTYLKRWCKNIQTIGEGADARPDVRSIIDWDYYRERLGSAIMKIITIPAAMQRVSNPVPRVRHPDWLLKRVKEREDTCRQRKLVDCFRVQADRAAEGKAVASMDIEDMLPVGGAAPQPRVARVTNFAAGQRRTSAGQAMSEPQLRPEGGEVVEAPLEEDKENADGNAPGAGGADTGPEAVGRKRGAEAEPAEAEPAEAEQAEEVEEVGPVRQEDYRGWLAAQKKRWKRARVERAKRMQQMKQREADAAAAADARGAPNGMLAAKQSSIFARQHNAASANHWQILQLAPTSQPGLYKAWVLLGTDLYAVPLRVPRHFYVNAMLDPEEAAGLGLSTRVSRTLPDSHRAGNIYEVVMDEAHYLARHSELATQLSVRAVAGTYEERLPLDLHATLALGCCAVVASQDAKGRALSREFSMAEMAMKTTSECSYLLDGGAEGLGPLRHVALYHSADIGRRRAVFCLLLPSAKRAVVQVVSPVAAGPQEVTSRLCGRAYQEAMSYLLADMEKTGISFPVTQEVEFAVHYSATDQDAMRQIGRALSDFKQTQRAPTVIVVESPMGLHNISHEMPILTEMPAVAVAAHSDDSAYPALGWQQHAVFQGVQRLAVHRQHLHDLIQAARYAHAPIGNMGREWLISTADMLFARCLRDAGHCLWISDPTIPELLGSPVADIDVFGDDHWRAHEVVVPGAYRQVCVELKLQNLAVCALDNAVLLSELEGSDFAAASGGDAFGVLRQLVTKWIQDAVLHGSRYADLLLSNIQRWLSTPSSLAYDPALQKALHDTMQKCFLQLVAEMRRLGATVVAADFGSVTICTGKHNLSAAVSYTEYLMEALARKELFKWLQLSPIRHWYTLLYRDQWNYAGVLADVPANVSAEAADEAESQAATQPRGHGYMDQWDIQHYLPPALQNAFRLIISEFVVGPWMHTQDASEPGASQGGTQAAAESQSKEVLQTDFLRRQVHEVFSPRMMKNVRTIQQQVGAGMDEPRHMFPQRAGSHLTPEELGTPALAFVRSVCAIMALDTRVEDEVALMRKNLLRMVHCKEFSESASFREPCLSFVLRNVICSYCNDCCDLDICRNADIQDKQWLCRMPECRQPYDRELVEARLVAEVQRAEAAYQLQDLQCAKCRMTAAGHMAERCTCGGLLNNTLPAAKHTSTMDVFHNIAEFHGFGLLREMVAWLLHT